MNSLPLLLCLVNLLASAANAKLFALNDTETPHVFKLVEVDPGTGKRVVVGKPGADTDFPYVPWTTSVDRDNGVLYVLGQKNADLPAGNLTLLGVSLTTGMIVSTTPIPVEMDSYGLLASSVAYAAELNLVILSFTTSEKAHLLGTIDPATPGSWNVVTSIDNPTAIGDVGGSGDGVYVPGQGEYIWQLAVNHVITQFAYNFKTATLRNATSPQFTDFLFNPKDAMLYGHGVIAGPKQPGTGVQYWMRTLEKMDPATLLVSQVKVLDELSVDAGGAICLDPENQILYWQSMLYKDAVAGGKMPVFIASVALDKNNTVGLSETDCEVAVFLFSGLTTPAHRTVSTNPNPNPAGVAHLSGE